MRGSRSSSRGTVKFSQLRLKKLRGDEEEGEVAASSEGISKYFIRGEVKKAPLASLYPSTSLTNIKVLESNDDDDFKPPVKLAKVFTNPIRTPVAKTKRKPAKKTKTTKPSLTPQTVQDNLGNGDCNPEHLQLALALSLSEQSEEPTADESENEDVIPVYPSTQQIRERAKTTLEQFGFKTTKTPRKNPPKTNNEVGRRKKRPIFQYVTPVLQLRTEEERREIISTKIAQILSSPSGSRVSSTDVAVLEVESEFLRGMWCHPARIFGTNEQTSREFFVKGLGFNSEESRGVCGKLLKDWAQIPGREVSPERENGLELLENYKIEKLAVLSSNKSPIRRSTAAKDIIELSSESSKDSMDFRNNFKRNRSVSPDLFESDDDTCHLDVSDKKSVNGRTSLNNDVYSQNDSLNELASQTDELNECRIEDCVETTFLISPVISKFKPKKRKKGCTPSKMAEDEEEKSSETEDFIASDNGVCHFESFRDDEIDMARKCLEHYEESDAETEEEKQMEVHTDKVSILDVDVVEVDRGRMDVVTDRWRDEVTGDDRLEDDIEIFTMKDGLEQEQSTKLDDDLDLTALIRSLEDKAGGYRFAKSIEVGERNVKVDSDDACLSSKVTNPSVASGEVIELSDSDCSEKTVLNLSQEIEKFKVDYKRRLSQDEKNAETSKVFSKHNSVDSIESNVSQESSLSISDEELNYSTVYSTPQRQNKCQIDRKEVDCEFDGVCQSSDDDFGIESQIDDSGHREGQSLTDDELEFETPNKLLTDDRLIIKLTNVTPMPDYDRMNSPEIVVELSKFGIKKLRREKGVQFLKHIYETTHPLLPTEVFNRLLPKRRRKIIHEEVEDANRQPENIFEDVNVGEEVVGEVILEKRQSKVHSCSLPLHVAFHNLVAWNREIRQSILLYEPLQLEFIYDLLKQQGHKYEKQDLISFLDRKCVTFRTNQVKKTKTND